MNLTPSEERRLRLLLQAAEEVECPMMIIGATARLLLLDWVIGTSLGRTTQDADVAVEVGTWARFNELKEALLRLGFRSTTAPHRLDLAGCGWIDIIPFGEIAEEDGTLTWPGEGQQMHVKGCELAFTGRVERTLKSGLTLPLVSLAGFVLLKVEAFLDRGPETDGVDLLDLDVVLRHYEDVLEDPDRVITETGEPIARGSIGSEDAGAYLLGRDLGELLPTGGFDPLTKFLKEMRDPYSRNVHFLVRHSLDDQDDQNLRESVVARFAAFGAGLTQTSQ